MSNRVATVRYPGLIFKLANEIEPTAYHFRYWPKNPYIQTLMATKTMTSTINHQERHLFSQEILLVTF